MRDYPKDIIRFKREKGDAESAPLLRKVPGASGPSGVPARLFLETLSTPKVDLPALARSTPQPKAALDGGRA